MIGAILVIEDETVLARNLQTFLGRHGYEVRTAESAEDGLALLRGPHEDVGYYDVAFAIDVGNELLKKKLAG